MKFSLLSFALSLYSATAVATNLRAAATEDRDLTGADCPKKVFITFSKNAETLDPYQAGEIIDELAYGIEVKAQKVNLFTGVPNGRNRAMIFDTAIASGGDTDLKVDMGKALIITEDFDSSDPDDREKGGLIKFTFPDGYIPNYIYRVFFLDIDEDGTFMDGKDTSGAMFGSVNVPNEGDGSYQFVQTKDFFVSPKELNIHMAGSGAIPRLIICYPY